MLALRAQEGYLSTWRCAHSTHRTHRTFKVLPICLAASAPALCNIANENALSFDWLEELFLSSSTPFRIDEVPP
jgi:hypothetical protein